jgi:hypothetical protein
MSDPLANLDAADAIAPGGGSTPLDPMAKLNAADALAESPQASGPKGPGPTKLERLGHGAADPAYGLGQAAEHLVEGPLNYVRTGVKGVMHFFGDQADAAAGQQTSFGKAVDHATRLFDPVTAQDFDKIVRQREAEYQKARADGQQHGFDWWRAGGNAAVTAPLAIAGAPAASVIGRIGQGAAFGAGAGMLEPSTNEGSFVLDKAKQAGEGALAGAAGAGLVESVAPVISKGVEAARKLWKPGAQDSVVSEAATAVNNALKDHGVDANTVNLNVLKGLRGEAEDALRQGGPINPASVTNRAQAESLPVPIKLTRGQASGDAMQFAKERNLRGVEGVGEGLTQRFTEQNGQLIANLDALGAKDAPDVASAGSLLTDRIRAVDDHLKSKISDAYSKVRNSQGQPAALDGPAYVKSVREALGPDEMFLPKEVRSTLKAIEGGKFPLTVETAQAFDKSFTGLQSGAPLSNTADRALEIAKSKLYDAPLTEGPRDVVEGRLAMEAYKQAKALAKSRFDMVDSNPGYAAVVKGARDADPDRFFQRFVMGGTGREVQALGQLADRADALGLANASANPQAGQFAGKGSELIGKTMLGEIKRNVVKGAGDRNLFSGDALNKYVKDPVWNARLSAALPQDVATGLRTLNSVAANIQRAPVASAVNTSNTGSAVANLVTGAGKGVLGLMGSAADAVLPGWVKAAGKGAAMAVRNGKEVDAALRPGVTTNVLPKTYRPSGGSWSKLLGMGSGAAANVPDDTQ